MRLLIIFMMLATAAYVGAFHKTHDPLVAVVAVGIVAFIYLIFLIITTTKPPFPRKLRYFSLTIVIISFGSMTAPFIEGHNTGHWQRSNLLLIRNVIVQGVMTAKLQERAIKTFDGYYNSDKPSKETFAEVFNRLNPQNPPGSNTLDTLFDNPETKKGIMQRLYVRSMTDSSVTIVGEDLTMLRQDSVLKSLGLRFWKPKVALHLSPKGMTYELE
jgi:hypothetical protein